MTLQVNLDFDVETGRLEEVAPGIRRIVAPNPGPFTFRGTGVYVIGRGEVAVIDPGPALDQHVDALVSALAGETITHILVTHTHADHSPAAAPLATLTGAPVYGFGPHPPPSDGVDVGSLVEPDERRPRVDGDSGQRETGDLSFSPDHRVGDGTVIRGPGWTIECIHTPGHLANHVAYRLQEQRVLFSGDHVMGWSTTVISPAGGNLRDYMSSLDKLLAGDDACYWPTHGPAIEQPHTYVRALAAHRRERTRQIVEELARRPARAAELVEAIYVGLDERLRRAAAHSVLAHMLALRDEGAVACDGATPGLGSTWHL